MALFTATPGTRLTMVRACTYMGINLFATPGLGSVMGGRKLAGRGQLVLSVAGFFLIVAWMLKIIFGSVGAEIGGEEAAPVPAWLWKFGTLFFGIAWLWSLVTSVGMLLEARETEASPPPVPPKLAGAVAPPPPALPRAALKPLDSFQISAGLGMVPAWVRQGSAISRRFQFKDFAAAMVFVNEVARLAEGVGHHPDIDIRWNMVTLALSTHEAGGLTDMDFALARQFDRLV